MKLLSGLMELIGLFFHIALVVGCLTIIARLILLSVFFVIKIHF